MHEDAVACQVEKCFAFDEGTEGERKRGTEVLIYPIYDTHGLHNTHEVCNIHANTSLTQCGPDNGTISPSQHFYTLINIIH